MVSRSSIIVSTHSIRYRILKVVLLLPTTIPIKVSTHSIRYRILKGWHCERCGKRLPSFNPFDPIQDTERWDNINFGEARKVSTHSIRYRILKAHQLAGRRTRQASFNPFDPIQDTESMKCFGHTNCDPGFQPIRSDTGY